MDSRGLPIIWQPNSLPQALFLSCPFPEVLFGGARGPGKTDSLLMDYLQFVGQGLREFWKGIIFRHTYKQLEEIVGKSERFFPSIIKGAKFRSTAMTWSFPDGETLRFRHAKRIADMENYQGHEYPFVGFDEICNQPSMDVYETAKGFCRSSNPQAPKLIRCTANPLGVGHLWVKRYFIDPAPPFTPITDAAGSKRVFSPATIYDNKHLIEADPKYLLRLESITDDNLRAHGSTATGTWSPGRSSGTYGRLIGMSSGRSPSPKAGTASGRSTGAARTPSPWAGGPSRTARQRRTAFSTPVGH